MSIPVIAVDHGNKNIKTSNHVFPSSFVESGHLPALGEDTLTYQGKEYTLTSHQLPHVSDKTTDDRYFILTLFALGKELINKRGDNFEIVELVLLAGLPPLHCKEMGERFANYFKRSDEYISFQFNKTPFTLRFSDVFVYPQAYAAVHTIADKLEDSRIVNIVDLGGYTFDLLQLEDFKPNMNVCTSLYSGINVLYQRINNHVRAKGKKDIPDSIIEGVLLNDQKIVSECSPQRISLIQSQAEHFTSELLSSVSQLGLDLEEDLTVFIGGGSLLLREYIEKSEAVARPLFVNDVKANAIGYEIVYNKQQG